MPSRSRRLDSHQHQPVCKAGAFLAVKQDLPQVTSTGSGHSGRRVIRTLKARRPRGLANRPGEPYPAAFRKCAGTELNRHSPKASGLRPPELTNAQPTQS
jgi:hypothetical protein